ncbi:hypothetical protein GCM10010345_37040 [Streptomyces canarius]|uniref:Aminoglycoside phosphotransferase domain-containing protein n=1 Tax=Streptomyces canarius TaxID=285453 RepID=A0ABQ3CM76_9ACTN|nr:hypothetical protein GCM10010345_37040 [Streptomyces canarius]
MRPLGGGTYNTVEELRLTDGRRSVLKTAPDPPGLRCESRLLRSEEEFCRAAAEAGVPAPRTVRTDGGPAARHTLQTHCPGISWDDFLTAVEQAALRRELGGHVARLHRVTGPGFGYPSGALGPLAPDWRTAFTAMTDAVPADARDYAADLPCPGDEVVRTLRSGHEVLEEVTVPRAVHFDLWPGNILVHRTDPASADSSTASACSGATRWPTSSPSPCWTTSRRTRTSSPVTGTPGAASASTARRGCGSRSTAPTST